MDSGELNALQAFDLHMEDAADTDVGGAGTEGALNSAKHLHVQTKWHGWKLGVKALQQLDEALARKHDVYDDRQAGLEPLQKSLDPGPQHLRAVGDGFSFGNDGFPSLRELYTSRCPAIEKR